MAWVSNLFRGKKTTQTKVEEKSWMKVHNIDIIKKHEGLRLEAYLPTPNDVWTIGYGHTHTTKQQQAD